MDHIKTAATMCSRCEALPARAEGPGQLYLWFPLGHTYTKVIPFLMDIESRFELRTEDQCVTILLTEGDRRQVVAGLAERLGPEELKDTKALFIASLEPPTMKDYANMTSLESFVKAEEANWLIDMLAEERFTSYFQPIVHTNDPSRVFAHEALFRGLNPEGGLIPPHQVFTTAREAGMLFQVDLQARRSAIRQAAALPPRGRVFINFNPSSIYDPTFCLRSTLRTIDDMGLDRSRVVFEVVESESVESVAHLAKILDYYRSMGFQVALDDLGSGYSGLNLVHQLRPDFIKLDMALVRGVDADPYKAVITSKLLELAHELNIPSIAEGVETAEELAWLREAGAVYVQGYLLGKPQPAQRETLAHA
jgi:EAL domain-containing protein (putative c-di-GMP-specific phosphodiesterase class I)